MGECAGHLGVILVRHDSELVVLEIDHKTALRRSTALVIHPKFRSFHSMRPSIRSTAALSNMSIDDCFPSRTSLDGDTQPLESKEKVDAQDDLGSVPIVSAL